MADVRLTATNPQDSSVVPVACNEKGELKLEEPLVVEGPPGEKGDKGDPGDPGDPFSGNFADGVTFGGSADFQGDVGIGTFDTSKTDKGGIDFKKNGRISVQRSLAEKDASILQGWAGTGKTVEIFANGGADFTGTQTILIPTLSGPNDTTNKATNLRLRVSGPNVNTPTADLRIGRWSDADGNAYTSLGFYMRDRGEYPDAYPNVFTLNSNGSAKFVGDVVIGSRGSQWMIVESGGLAHLIQQTTSFKGQPRNNEYPQLRNIPDELTMVEQALAEVMEKLRMTPPAGWEVWDGWSENS